MKTDSPHSKLRIIAGHWRGRKLAFIPLPGLRPTPDRVRETLFNWLTPVVRGGRCLDLFAGSGVLGFEAASRSAGRVILVDNNPTVTQLLQENAEMLGATCVQVVTADGPSFLQGPHESFDIVFLDPPFREGLLAGCIRQLESGDWLAAEAWIYIEAERSLHLESLLPDNWELYRSKTAGQVAYHLVRRTATV